MKFCAELWRYLATLTSLRQSDGRQPLISAFLIRWNDKQISHMGRLNQQQQKKGQCDDLLGRDCTRKRTTVLKTKYSICMHLKIHLKSVITMMRIIIIMLFRDMIHGATSPCGDTEDTVLFFHVCLTVNGAWSCWSSWSPCSAGCGGGHYQRTRSCSSPAPSSGGDICLGLHTEEALCNTHPCDGEVTCSHLVRNIMSGYLERFAKR